MNVIELAKQAGYQHLPTVRLAYSGFDLERFAALHRAQVLDEAARACKDVSSNSGSEQYNIFGKDLAEQCADAIRALKEKT